MLDIMFDIEIDYTTGGSFNLKRSKETLGNPSSLKNAKENLRRIKEHYIDCHDNPNSDKKYGITLLTDDGERTIDPFWIGWFETLHGARVIADGDTDMSFEFN